VLQALLAQRRYADAAAEAARDHATGDVAALAAGAGMFACAALGDPAQLGAAIEQAERHRAAAGELALYRAWLAVIGGAPAGSVAETALEPALAALEALLRVREFDVFGQLACVYECIDAPPDERQGRLAQLYLRCGYVDSAEDEWRRGALGTDALVGLAQVALVRERPGEAALLAAQALDRDPASPQARSLVLALEARES
jgi:hypothetical protein